MFVFVLWHTCNKKPFLAVKFIPKLQAVESCVYCFVLNIKLQLFNTVLFLGTPLLSAKVFFFIPIGTGRVCEGRNFKETEPHRDDD